MITNDNSMISLIRKLTSTFGRLEIEDCINTQITTGSNSCLLEGKHEETINILAKAGHISSMMDEGATLNTALRDLGRKMRLAINN